MEFQKINKRSYVLIIIFLSLNLNINCLLPSIKFVKNIVIFIFGLRLIMKIMPKINDHKNYLNNFYLVYYLIGSFRYIKN